MRGRLLWLHYPCCSGDVTNCSLCWVVLAELRDRRSFFDFGACSCGRVLCALCLATSTLASCPTTYCVCLCTPSHGTAAVRHRAALDTPPGSQPPLHPAEAPRHVPLRAACRLGPCRRRPSPCHRRQGEVRTARQRGARVSAPSTRPPCAVAAGAAQPPLPGQHGAGVGRSQQPSVPRWRELSGHHRQCDARLCGVSVCRACSANAGA